MVGLNVTASNAMQVSDGIWLVELPPHQIKFFGDCRNAEGERSVILVSDPQFDAKTGALAFDTDGVTPLNIGASNTVVALRSKTPSLIRVRPSDKLDPDSGDKQFLSELESLPKDLVSSGRLLLSTIRAKFPGDLKPTRLGKYMNWPDNFWTIKVQPRVKNLALTVRGVPERFGKSSLEIKPDQNGYSRFWLRKPEELQEALRIVFVAQRRS
jgi:hypothetical protein